MRTVTITVVMGLGLLLTTTAAADEQSEAKAAFEEGKVLFESGKFSEAAEAFRKANELNPNWKLLYNIGQSEAAAKRYGLALDAFEKYLAGGGDEVAKDRQDEVMEEVRRLRDMVGVLEVAGQDGDQLEVNGVVRGVLPDGGRVKVGMGEVSLRVVRGGEEVLSRTLSISGGETVAVDVDEQDGAAMAPGSGPDDATDGDGKKTLRTVGWVTLGVGAAVLVGGSITGGMALSLNSDLSDQCGDGTCTTDDKQGDLDKRDGLAKTSTVLLAIGGAVAATGIVLLVVGSVGKEDPGADGASEVSVAPTVGPGFAGAAITGRF